MWTPGLGSRTEQKGEGKLRTSIHLSLLFDCGGNVSNCLTHLLSQLELFSLPCFPPTTDRLRLQAKITLSFLQLLFLGVYHSNMKSNALVSTV